MPWWLVPPLCPAPSTTRILGWHWIGLELHLGNPSYPRPLPPLRAHKASCRERARACPCTEGLVRARSAGGGSGRIVRVVLSFEHRHLLAICITSGGCCSIIKADRSLKVANYKQANWPETAKTSSLAASCGPRAIISEFAKGAGHQ